MSRIATEKTARAIQNNSFLVLGTSAENQPWLAPLFFTFDGLLNFYIISGRETLHVRHLEQNPHCAITLFNSTDHPDDLDWVKMSAEAHEVQGDILPQVLNLYYRRRFPDKQERLLHRHVEEDFTGAANHRFYCLRPTSISTMDLTATEDSINRRVDVEIDAVRNLLNNSQTF